MSNPIYIKYEPDQDPVETLEAAMREHGEHEAFVMVPAQLWNRWKIKPASKQLSLFNERITSANTHMER